MDVTTVACSVTDCSDPVDRKGYCRVHYTRQWRYGEVGLRGPQPKPCARCGDVFQPPHNRNIYCSEECRRGRATCLACGTQFLVKPGAGGKYCSTTCWYGVERRAAKDCPICSATFSGQSRTCSKACGYELRKQNNPERRTECGQCGVVIVKKTPTTRYCSRACAMQGRPSSPRQPRHPDGTRRPGPTGYVQLKVDGAWKAEHRHVVEQQIGRPLLPHERVHHKNGRRDDNRPENLELWRIKGKDPAGVRASDYHCPGCRCSEL